MAEFQVGTGPPPAERTTRDRLLTVWEWFITPDDTGNLVPPTAVQSVAEEIDDQLAGRGGNNAAEMKGIEKAAEKLVRGGPIGEAIVKLFFGDEKAGAPDPDARLGIPFTDEEGINFQFNERGEKVRVQMLPMWTADP